MERAPLNLKPLRVERESEHESEWLYRLARNERPRMHYNCNCSNVWEQKRAQLGEYAIGIINTAINKRQDGVEASEADIVLPTHKIDIRARRREDHSEGSPYIRRLRWIALAVAIGWQLYQRFPVYYTGYLCVCAVRLCASSRSKVSHQCFRLDSVSFRYYT